MARTETSIHVARQRGGVFAMVGSRAERCGVLLRAENDDNEIEECTGRDGGTYHQAIAGAGDQRIEIINQTCTGIDDGNDNGEVTMKLTVFAKGRDPRPGKYESSTTVNKAP